MGCCQCAKPTNPGQISVLEWNPIATSFHLLPWRPLGNTMEVQGTCGQRGTSSELPPSRRENEIRMGTL